MIKYADAISTVITSGAEKMGYCTTCGHQNPATVDTCLHCGAALEKKCSVCGQVVSATSKFCAQCGAPLPDSQAPAAALRRSDEVRQNLRALMPTTLAQKISAAAGDILGEQREVSILFANVTNFTTSPYPIDNEDSYLLMNKALSLLVEIVYKYEGTIDKFTGDGLVALFGAPVAHENDPERAVRVALEMQTVIQSWQREIKQSPGFDLQIRIGINTGPVIAGKVGNDLHMDYTVIGETVNLAYHLQLMAEFGAILISQETYQRIRSLFEFRILPPLSITWLPQPIQALQPVGLREKPGGMGDVLGWQVPMIGRAYDLARLQNALAAVRQHGQSQIALITGEAGVGKSRLVTEFCRSLQPAETRVYRGHCLTYAQQKPLWIIAEIVRDLIHLSQVDSAEVQQEELLAGLQQVHLAQAEILPYLAHLLGLAQTEPQLEARLQNLDPTVLQRQTHSAVRQLFIAAARLGPTVLIFEDLHWVDPASRDFLEYLIQTTGDVPLLLVLVSREAERETAIRPLVTAAQKEPERLVDLQLQALTATEGQLLADQLIPQNTAGAQQLKRHIVARAESNPFYIEEIIHMLIDQGGLVRVAADGSWQVTPQADELLSGVPGTVKGLILARFDRLPESLRWLLQKAAILGPSFPVSLLHPLTKASSETVSMQLDQLAARQFLKAAPFRSQPGYTFRHALLQETIYSTLLKRDRGKIHAQVAQAIEDSPLWLAEERAEILAYHYVRSASPPKAVPHLITAAENAARRCAYETAIVHYRQAISLLPAQPDESTTEFFRVRLGLAEALKFAGEFSAASQVLSEILPHLWGWDMAATSESLKPILMESLRQFADVRQREGNYDQAVKYLEAGLQTLGEDSNPAERELRRSLLDRLAWIRFRQGQLAEAFALASQATANLDATEPGDPLRLASLFNTLGGVAWQQGQLTEAVTYVQRSLDLYESVSYLWGMATAYGNLGILYFVLGNWPKAADYYERAFSIHKIIGNPEGQAHALDNLGVLHTATGEYETARRELTTGLATRQRLGDTWGTAQSHVNLAYLALVQSDLAEAATHTQTALTLSDAIGSTEIQVPARWCLALVQAGQMEELQPGLKLAEEALEMARTMHFIEGEVDSLRVLGILYTQAGEYLQAETCLLDSVELSLKQNTGYRRGLALYELGRLYVRLAQLNQPVSDDWPVKALKALNEAGELFKTLGAVHYLHRVQLSLRDIQAENTAAKASGLL
jgi:class 3 adenylate cyclase/tetratricopeptide (TPR) repeat protein